MSGCTLAVLAYHRLGTPGPGSWENWYLVSEQAFAEHLDVLDAGGWQAIGAAELLAGLRDPSTLPERAALVTFDDAYRSVADVALPHLAERGLPGVVFVPTDHVGATNAFDLDTDQPQEAICGWDDLARLQAGGVSVQSHGVTHRSLAELDVVALHHELAASTAAIEEALGTPATLFSYPYGAWDADLDVIAPLLRLTRYRAAFLYSGAVATVPAPDPYAIDRLTIGSDTDLERELFGALAAG